MHVYATITDALTDLDSRGYNLDSNLTAERFNKLKIRHE